MYSAEQTLYPFLIYIEDTGNLIWSPYLQTCRYKAQTQKEAIYQTALARSNSEIHFGNILFGFHLLLRTSHKSWPSFSSPSQSIWDSIGLHIHSLIFLEAMGLFRAREAMSSRRSPSTMRNDAKMANHIDRLHIVCQPYSLSFFPYQGSLF